MLKIALALASSMLAGSAGALTFLTASLNNASENPPAVPTTFGGQPRPASFGTASFFIDRRDDVHDVHRDDLQHRRHRHRRRADINDNLTAAHIHAGRPSRRPPTRPVVWGFFGAPFNDNAPNDSMMTPFASGVGGTFSGKWDLAEGQNTTLTAQLPNILAGRSYINFHTTQFGGGEIRGNIAAIPEPETYALMLGGLAVVAGVARRRARGARAPSSA